jgi:hypothetical protein
MEDRMYRPPPRITSGGATLGTVLLVVFLTLKLTDQITWSWWWVLTPVWAPIGLWLTGLATMFVLAAFVPSLFRRR